MPRKPKRRKVQRRKGNETLFGRRGPYFQTRPDLLGTNHLQVNRRIGKGRRSTD